MLGNPGAPFFNDAVAATAVELKASAGTLAGLAVANKTAAVAYLQIFNKPAADVIVGTTVPVIAIRLAANESRQFPFPLELGGTGISAAGTTDAGGLTGAAISVVATVA